MQAAEQQTEGRRPFIEPGWYRDLSNDDYHGSFGTSSSQLKKLIEHTPAHLAHSWTVSQDGSPSMALGTAVHTLVLEAEKFDREIAVMPDINRRTNAGKAEYAQFMLENSGKEIITSQQMDQAYEMAESVLSHDYASALLEDAITESSVYWWYRTNDVDEIADGERFKEMLKVRPDALSVGHPVVVDLKTTRDGSYSGFGKDIAKYYYHVSAAMYLEGINQCRPLLEATRHFAYTNFVFICVESEAPYLTSVYELSKDDLELGKQIYRRMLRKLREARAEDFPGFPNEIRVIELPAWARRGFVV